MLKSVFHFEHTNSRPNQRGVAQLASASALGADSPERLFSPNHSKLLNYSAALMRQALLHSAQIFFSTCNGTTGETVARINIEDSLWSDPRFMKLCIRLGDERTAIGAVILAWKTAQKHWCPHKNPIPNEEWAQAGIGREIIDVGLAKEVDDGIYVAGSEEHFDWYFERLSAAKAGGKARMKNVQRDSSGRLVAAGVSARQNQPSSSSSSSNSFSNSKEEEEGPPPPPSHEELLSEKGRVHFKKRLGKNYGLELEKCFLYWESTRAERGKPFQVVFNRWCNKLEESPETEVDWKEVFS